MYFAFTMSRLIATIFVALSILKCTRAATTYWDTRYDVKKLKCEVEETMNGFQSYIENRLNQITTFQDIIQKEFMDEIKNKIGPLVDEIENGSLEEENYAKIKCMRAAKERIDNFEAMLPKIVQECIGREEKVELNNLFNSLLDSASDGQRLIRLIERLENDVKLNDYRNLNIERRISSGKMAAESMKLFLNNWMEKGDKIMEKAKNQSKECSNNQLVVVHSSVVEIFNSCVDAL